MFIYVHKGSCLLFSSLGLSMSGYDIKIILASQNKLDEVSLLNLFLEKFVQDKEYWFFEDLLVKLSIIEGFLR